MREVVDLVDDIEQRFGPDLFIRNLLCRIVGSIDKILVVRSLDHHHDCFVFFFRSLVKFAD